RVVSRGIRYSAAVVEEEIAAGLQVDRGLGIGYSRYEAVADVRNRSAVWKRLGSRRQIGRQRERAEISGIQRQLPVAGDRQVETNELRTDVMNWIAPPFHLSVAGDGKLPSGRVGSPDEIQRAAAGDRDLAAGTASLKKSDSLVSTTGRRR